MTFFACTSMAMLSLIHILAPQTLSRALAPNFTQALSPTHVNTFANILSAQPSINLGANAKSQAICFSLCLLAGFISGIFALLYFRKSSVAERILTDAVATILIAGVFLLCVEFILDGKMEIYGALAYAFGVCVIPFVYKKTKARAKSRKTPPSTE